MFRARTRKENSTWQDAQGSWLEPTPVSGLGIRAVKSLWLYLQDVGVAQLDHDAHFVLEAPKQCWLVQAGAQLLDGNPGRNTHYGFDAIWACFSARIPI